MGPSITHAFAYARALPSAIAGTDLRAIAAELDGVFRRHGARSQPTNLDLTFRVGRIPTAGIATFVLESDRISRIVVSHVRVAPFYAGLAVAVHPRPEFDAPVFVADVGIPPPGVTRLFVDACGPAISKPGFHARFGDPLGAVVNGAHAFQRDAVPAWLLPLSGGAGARLKARPGKGEGLLRVLVRYTDRYLDALDSADKATDPKANAASARSVRDAVRANGAAGKYVARFFGDEFAGKYMRLLWNDENEPV